jgi:large subunit ribosomal protein L15
MRLHELTAPAGARHSRKRVARGIGSGHGKTSGRGHKGFKARNSKRPGFEGGQTPLYMRLGKHRGRGKGAMPQRMFHHEYAIINVTSLQKLAETLGSNPAITPQVMMEYRVINKLCNGIRILGGGELTAAVTAYAHHFSEAARTKIEAAGGTAVVLPLHSFAPALEESGTKGSTTEGVS